MGENQITIAEACKFLGISRPTFNKVRDQFKLSFVRIGREHRFRKDEIISKIIQHLPATGGNIDLCISSKDVAVSALKLDENTYDLRRLNLIDGFGMFALMENIHGQLAQGRDINLIIDDEYACKYLCESRFFLELESQFPKTLFLSTSPKNLLIKFSGDSFLPLTRVGFKNAEQTTLDQVVVPILKQQGFSETISGYIFWAIGELMDNAHTHAKANGHCYMSIHRFGNERKYLQIDIADLGIGIPKSLKSSKNHANLTDRQALARAFKSRISSWPEEHNRGKGLSDVLGVAIGNQSLLRVESGGEGFRMTFSGMGKHAEIQTPMTAEPGTRIALVLIDQEFRHVPREEADQFVSEKLEIL